MNVTKSNFNEAYEKSKENNFFNRSLGFCFVVGVSIGMALMHYIYNNKIDEYKSQIESQAKLIEILELKD